MYLIYFLFFYLDIDECATSGMSTCDTSTGGEICINLPGTFKCECNNNLGFFRIDGKCQSKFKFSLPIFIISRSLALFPNRRECKTLMQEIYRLAWIVS